AGGRPGRCRTRGEDLCTVPTATGEDRPKKDRSGTYQENRSRGRHRRTNNPSKTNNRQRSLPLPKMSRNNSSRPRRRADPRTRKSLPVLQTEHLIQTLTGTIKIQEHTGSSNTGETRRSPTWTTAEISRGKVGGRSS